MQTFRRPGNTGRLFLFLHFVPRVSNIHNIQIADPYPRKYEPNVTF